MKDDEYETPAVGAKATPEEPKTGFAALIAKILALRPVRVFLHYGANGGALLAAGMTYQAVFALFAAIWVAFSVLGFVVAANPTLQQAIFDAINNAVPGIVGEDGLISPDTLESTDGLTWTAAIALIGLLLTAVGFLASMRDAIRRIFDLPTLAAPFAIQKAKDLGLAFGFGAVILISAILSVVSTAALGAVFGLLGIDDESLFAVIVARIIGYVIVFAIDLLTLAAAYRILSAIRIPPKRLFAGAAIGAAALGVLKAAVTLGLIGGTGSNPLLAGFAVLGLMIFLNFVCQAMLIAASWISVGMKDAGIDPRSLSEEELELEHARQLEDARRLVAKSNLERAKEEYRGARGIRKWRLARQIRSDAREEAKRRESVPTTDELAKADDLETKTGSKAAAKS
ncbi:ribonuclease [Amnibacterium flavum]|uniref:Ribonuclease n=1 Tax=Amnibacterium flavum TaxID=2173173 RepID=A0A2V1HVN0_9MICO|nr:ribonuclease [Amnibacterium flavum]